MRAVSPRQRRSAALARGRVTVSGYPAHGDHPARTARRDTFAILAEAAKNRTLHATGFALPPAMHPSWAAAARANLRAARLTDTLARRHGFRLPESA
jgi:hypothetical protein